MKFLFNRKVSLILICIVLIESYNSASMITNTSEEIPINDENIEQENEDVTKCNEEILIQYSLFGSQNEIGGQGGEGKPTNIKHDYCPNISQNCCSQADQDRSYENWTDEIKPVVER